MLVVVLEEDDDHLVLLVDVDALLHQELEDGTVALPGRPAHPAVPGAVHGAQVGSVGQQDLQHLQPAQAGRDVDPALPVLVALVHVDVGHAEQLHQAALVVLLDGAEDGGEDEVVILADKFSSLLSMTGGQSDTVKSTL